VAGISPPSRICWRRSLLDMREKMDAGERFVKESA